MPGSINGTALCRAVVVWKAFGKGWFPPGGLGEGSWTGKVLIDVLIITFDYWGSSLWSSFHWGPITDVCWSSSRQRESLQSTADVWTQQRLLLQLRLLWAHSHGSKYPNWESLRTKHPWEQGWGKPMVTPSWGQPKLQHIFWWQEYLRWALQNHRKTCQLPLHKCSLCLPATHCVWILPFLGSWGRNLEGCCVMEHSTDHRTQRCKSTGCSTAPALSFRPVSTTLLTLRSNLLCTRSAFLQSLDCHIDVAFQFWGQFWMEEEE